MTLQLKNTHRISATLLLKSGLHIGAGKDTIEIGGLDLPVVKNPFSQEPYIPGSSVKGKLRSLLEWALGKVEDNGEVWGSKRDGSYPKDDPVLRTFGTTNKRWHETHAPGPTRLVVRDAPLNRAWADSIRDRGLPFTEEKMEVSVDRIQGKAGGGGPRRIERVPASAEFDLEMSFKVFDVDGDGGRVDGECLDRLLEALKLLEKDALGGSGSRGYGRVEVQNLSVDDRPIAEAFDAITAISLDAPARLVGQEHYG